MIFLWNKWNMTNGSTTSMRFGKKYGITPKTILDLGCGTGSILLPLAQEGFDVIGVDLSPEMLTEADHKAMEAGVSVRLACQDMTELDLGEQADCILSLCDCMNYLIEDGSLECPSVPSKALPLT